MTDIKDVPLTTITGDDDRLAAHAGKVLLIVNTASKCGLTPQYEGLEALYRKYRDEGFEVLGFPANDFGGQEPGSEAEIADFCQTRFDVSFPMFAKVTATGPDKHPLYAALTEARPSATSVTGDAMRARLEQHGRAPAPEPELLWNFEKFVVGRDGQVVARFAPDTPPDAPELVTAIERELHASE